MSSYFGKIEIGKIENRHDDANKNSSFPSGFKNMGESHVKVVHYPDCQQLIVWLPQPGREYTLASLINKSSGLSLHEWQVDDLLNGAIQVVWDTLGWAPGPYTLRIEWKGGIQHLIEFEKKEERIADNETGAEMTKPIENSNPTRSYRDGFGKLIPDEDLILRRNLNKVLEDKFGRRIEYEGNFRAGTIRYIAMNSKIEFNHEMGAGNCMFYIEIPDESAWELSTRTPLSERREILEFVAQTVRAEQASNCYYLIKNEIIGFYYQ